MTGMLKKITNALLFFSLILGVFLISGCEKKEQVPVNGEVTTQEQLDAALASDDITEIKLVNNSSYNYNIPSGQYMTKTIVLNSSFAQVENHANFLNIVIKEDSDNSWLEFVTGNKFDVEAKTAKIVVQEGFYTSAVNVNSTGGTVTLGINGTVLSLNLLQATKVDIIGNTTASLTVTAQQIGNIITSKLPIKYTLKEKDQITLIKGAEKSQLALENKDIDYQFINDTNDKISIDTGTKKTIEIAAGSKVLLQSEDEKKE